MMKSVPNEHLTKTGRNSIKSFHESENGNVIQFAKAGKDEKK